MMVRILPWIRRETQNLASHKWVRPISSIPYLYVFIAMGWTGDARFCVSTGLAPLRYRVKRADCQVKGNL